MDFARNITSSTLSTATTLTPGNESLSALNTTKGLADLAEEEHIYVTIARWLDVYLLGLITLCGFITNFLTLLVLNRKGAGRSSIRVYLSTLACSDAMVLFTNGLNNWFRATYDKYLIAHSDIGCKIYHYVFSASYMYSAWIVVALAVERFIAVTFPLQAKRVTSAKKAVGTVIIILAVDLLAMIYMLFVYKKNDNICDWHPDFLFFHMNINGWVLGVLYSYIPFFLLLGSSVGIIYGLGKAARKRAGMTTDPDKASVHRVAKTVVCVTMSYLVLTTPIAMFYLILYNLGMWVESTPVMTLLQAAITNLGTLNYAINFFLYVMTSASFRKDLARLMKCSRKDESAGKYLEQSKSTALPSMSTALPSISKSFDEEGGL